MSKSSPTKTDLLSVGKIVAAHGIKGSLQIKPSTDFIERFAPRSTVFIGDKPYLIKGNRIHKDAVLLDVEGVVTRNDAEALIGLEVFADDLPLSLPSDEFMVRDLIGMEVHDRIKGALGTVSDVLMLPGQDVLAVGDLLVPFRQEFVKSVDLPHRRIEVELLDGMLEQKP